MAVSNCEFNANFLTFLGLYHYLETIGVALPSLKFQQGTFPIQGAEISTFFVKVMQVEYPH